MDQMAIIAPLGDCVTTVLSLHLGLIMTTETLLVCPLIKKERFLAPVGRMAAVALLFDRVVAYFQSEGGLVMTVETELRSLIIEQKWVTAVMRLMAFQTAPGGNRFVNNGRAVFAADVAMTGDTQLILLGLQISFTNQPVIPVTSPALALF